MIQAIILAAGLSSRMGFPKQLLKLGDRPLVRVVVENVLASEVDGVLVVTGCRGEEVSAAVNDLPVKIVNNPDYEQGQGLSLAQGVKALDTKTTAFLVFMCDQPFISSSMINTVIREFKKRHCLALRPVYHGIPGHPVIFNYALSPEMELLTGDEGARQVLRKLGSKVDYLPVEDESVIIDIDTLECYVKLRADGKMWTER